MLFTKLKLDQRKGYWQISVLAWDIITPFGLKNAGQTFQCFMDKILQGVSLVFVYLDDLLIACSDRATHIKDIQQVMEILKKHGLVINQEKCKLCKDQAEFLSHLVDSMGIKPLMAKVEGNSKYPQLDLCSKLLNFLSKGTFYRRFLKGASKVFNPLTMT